MRCLLRTTTDMLCSFTDLPCSARSWPALPHPAKKCRAARWFHTPKPQKIHTQCAPFFLAPPRPSPLTYDGHPPAPRYGIQMRVHDWYRLAQTRSAKQKSKRTALQWHAVGAFRCNKDDGTRSTTVHCTPPPPPPGDCCQVTVAKGRMDTTADQPSTGTYYAESIAGQLPAVDCPRLWDAR